VDVTLQKRSWAGHTVYCKAEVVDTNNLKADVIHDTAYLSAPATKPVVSNLRADDTGSQGDGKVRVRYSISTNSSLKTIRTHCGIGSGYSDKAYVDSSTGTRYVDVTLQKRSWAGHTVYCKAEVVDTNNNKADVKQGSVYLSY
jgi:hypothetical protein